MSDTGYLCVSRYPGESLLIDGRIEVSVSKVKGNRVYVLVKCLKSVPVIRMETLGGSEDESSTKSSE